MLTIVLMVPIVSCLKILLFFLPVFWCLWLILLSVKNVMVLPVGVNVGQPGVSVHASHIYLHTQLMSSCIDRHHHSTFFYREHLLYTDTWIS